MTDPYTMDARLCDDAGMVSDQPVDPGNLGSNLDSQLTYRKQLNNLRAQTGLPPYTGEAFSCTGSAHLARQHIRCTSPAHRRYFVEQSTWAVATIHRDSPLWEVAAERGRQNVKWGEQNHPDGTGPEIAWAFTGPAAYVAEAARTQCQHEAEEGATNWRSILTEEVAEAYAEDDPAKLRAELVQVASVAVAWIEAIDRRAAAPAVAEVAGPSYRAFLGENPCSDPTCPCHPQPAPAGAASSPKE